ncbi:MAG: glycoside hydrolase family 5 protein [Huintestinicola sp.]
MTLKKITALLAAAVMTCSCLAGCSSSSADKTADNTSSAEVSDTASAADEFSVPEMSEMRDISSMELISEMKIGWNLGNTLDSVIGDPTGSETPENWETAWGNPVTTKTMIDRVKAEGFNVLRVPVTWEGKFGEGPDYTIDPEWLARVKEVVDYGIENDMFVILNTHHENGWGMPFSDNVDRAEEILRALWSQIADYFKDYNEYLIFEGLNEPRLRETNLEWNGGDAESRAAVCRLDAAFVETVRASGGNNALRHLMVPTYAASSADNVLKDFVVPDDDKVIVSIHAYLPYSFALADNGTKEWSADNSADTKDIDYLFANLKDTFIDKGQAVIIGEFGSRNRILNTEARADCARYYITKAKEVGIPCIWWDNNAFMGSGENFGLFDRTTFEWRFPEIMTALMEAAGVEA